MDLERLQEFVVIARYQSIKKAAEALCIAPATLNARLHAFEASLDTSLFTRTRGRLALTVRGSRLYADACRITGDYQQLKQEISRPDACSFQSLRIAIAEAMMPFYLGPFLDMLNAKNPHLHLDLLDDTSCSITDGLHSGQVDLYFAPVMNQFSAEGITKYSFAPSQQYIILPSTHRLASKESISLSELDRECFILYPQTRESCVRDFQLANLNASGIRYTVYDSHSSPVFNHLFVPIGKGLLLSPVPVTKEPPNSVCLPLTDVPYPSAFAMFYLKNCSNPEVARFTDYFKRFIKERTTAVSHPDTSCPGHMRSLQ